MGERFDNLRVSFPLTRWRRLPIPDTSSSIPLSSAAALEIARPLAPRAPKVAQLPTDDTFVYLIGMQDGEWLKAWEDAIAEGVRKGRRGVTLAEGDRTVNAGVREQLRGYD